MRHYKILAFALLNIVLIPTLFSQSKLGLQVGVDYAKIENFDFHEGSFSDIVEDGFANPSFLFGISGEHKLAKKWSGEISVSHTFKKGIVKNDFGFDPNFFTFSLEYNALSTSIIAKHEVLKNTHFGLGILSRYIYKAREIRVDRKKLFANKNENNIGLVLSLGYDYKSFTIQTTYAIGKKLPLDLESEFFVLVERIQSLDFRIIYKFSL